MAAFAVGIGQGLAVAAARNAGAGLAVEVPDVVNQTWEDGERILTQDKLVAETEACLRAAGPRGHILNVGHGVPQGAPERLREIGLKK